MQCSLSSRSLSLCPLIWFISHSRLPRSSPLFHVITPPFGCPFSFTCYCHLSLFPSVSPAPFTKSPLFRSHLSLLCGCFPPLTSSLSNQDWTQYSFGPYFLFSAIPSSLLFPLSAAQIISFNSPLCYSISSSSSPFMSLLFLLSLITNN